MNYYFEKRKHLKYYSYLRKELDNLSGSSILDVGPHGTDIVMSGRFDRRVVVDLFPHNKLQGVESHVCDFLEWKPEPAKFSVVTCFQVLEHMSDDKVVPFAHKLHSIFEDRLVVSVPFMWPLGRCKDHKQDPVPFAKVAGWFPCKPGKWKIVNERNGVSRMVLFWFGKSS